MSKYIWILPADVLLFRDGRPFAQGGDHYAESVFPPSPSVLYGALRATGIANSQTSLHDFAIGKSAPHVEQSYGSSNRHGEFKISGFFVGRNEEPLFPAPFDLVLLKRNASDRPIPILLRPLRNGTFASSLHGSLLPLWAKEDGTLEHKSGFLTLDQFQAYLSGQTPAGYLFNDQFRQIENRTGVAINPETATVKTGMLYTAQYLRLAGESRDDQFGFIVKCEGDDLCPLPSKGWLRLGGESRPAYYVQLSSCDYPSPADFSDKRFKLVLSTPALFENGWLPGNIRERDGTLLLEDSAEGISAKLVAAIIGRPIPLGGWNIVTRRPKSILLGIPAGSVYFFELISGTPEAVKQKFHGNCISDFSQTLREGFGLTFVGGWNYV